MKTTKAFREILEGAVRDRYAAYISELWRERKAKQSAVAAQIEALVAEANEEALRICEAAGLSPEDPPIKFSAYNLNYCTDPEVNHLREQERVLNRAPRCVVTYVLFRLETGSLKKNELEEFLDSLDFMDYIPPEDALR